ncbi:NADH-cytochrome b5 reductase [Niveomyces insectorum RCEF 264]|uniref:NADH-cytochrome b5 reductase n=1 Tax=Niveomyces insectorum RCEF 264 TaxID=1081102 RepID=A0A167YZF7_9HYPO|nr:NADH-cytochrome b5 reductase [Niveomyces insectorum RCEF 264]
MSTTVLVAAAAVAVGAYAFYTRRFATAQAESVNTPPKPTFSGVGFRTLTLTSTESVNHNVKHLRFALSDPQATSGLSLTSALLTVSWPKGRWLPVLRPYTPVNDLDDRGHLDLFVKLYPGGKQSGHLHQLQPGDTLTCMRIPGYRWSPAAVPPPQHVALVAGGQGITPCYQLLRGILANPEDRTRVTLVWGVNTDADLFLATEIAALQAKYPGRLTTRYVVSQPAAGSTHTPGHVTTAVLRTAGVVPPASAGIVAAAATKKDGVSKVFLSGPPAMEKALTKADGLFAQLGFTKKDVHTF